MKHAIQINSRTSPIVEVDNVAEAAYVRFSDNPVARTEIVHSGTEEITMDIDAEGEAVGIEFIGIKEFTIKKLLNSAGIQIPQVMLDAVRYLPSGTAVGS